MPKKRSRIPYTKPASSVHPALLTHSHKNGGNASHSASTNGQNRNRVNELINHLRITQVSTNQQHGRPHQSANAHTVPPLLGAAANAPDTPPMGLASGLRIHSVGRRRTRGPAGPPPPASWTYSPSQRRSVSTKQLEQTSSRTRVRYNELLPGMGSLAERSLYNTALKQLGSDWGWHAHYDQYFIATLPLWIKQQLLSSIARYNEKPLELEDLQLLFLDDTQLQGATGSEAVTHLDLSRSSIALKSLASYVAKKVVGPHHAASEVSTSDQSPGKSHSLVPDSWEDPSSPSMTSFVSILRFPYLTHLSLASPARPSWSALLSVLPIISTLTHLSLACWPIPCLTPNSMTAYTSAPSGEVPQGASNLYSGFDGDFSEAAGIMRRLSKVTYCLRWLDLSGCADWVPRVFVVQGAADWHDAWKGLETIKIHHAWTPRCIYDGRWADLLSSTFGGRRLPGTEPKLSETQETEALEVLEWLRRESCIHENAASARKAMTRRFKAEEMSEHADNAAQVPVSRTHLGNDSWWSAPSDLAVLGPAKEPSRKARTMRRDMVTFDQGWESHPQVKACIDACLGKVSNTSWGL